MQRPPLPPSSTRSKGITKVVTKGPDLTPFWPPSPFTAFPTSEAEAKAAAKVEAAKSSSIPIKAAPGPLPGTSQAPTTRPGPRAHQSAITSPRQLPAGSPTGSIDPNSSRSCSTANLVRRGSPKRRTQEPAGARPHSSADATTSNGLWSTTIRSGSGWVQSTTTAREG